MAFIGGFDIGANTAEIQEVKFGLKQGLDQVRWCQFGRVSPDQAADFSRKSDRFQIAGKDAAAI